jgi:hypothetical protein
MKNFSFSKILPYIIAIPIILIVAAIYFKPEVFDGKVLQQSDVMQFEGMSKMTQDFTKKTGEPSLWNVQMFSGFPEYLFAGYSDGVLHYLFKISTGFFEIGSSMQLFFMLAACGWGMMLCFRINPYLALAGGLSIAFSTFYIISLEVGHVTKLWAIAYSATVLGGLHLFFTGKKWLGLALFSLFLSLQMRANHYQITYYLVFVCAIYTINEFWQSYKNNQLASVIKNASLLLVALVLVVATQLGRLWMTYEYTPYSIRGNAELESQNNDTRSKAGDGLDKDYAYSWSQGKMETFTLLIPYFYGGGSSEKLREDSEIFQAFSQVMGKEQLMKYMKNDGIPVPLYYGDQPFTAGPLYAGAIICFLFALSIFVLEDKYRWWMLSAAILCTMFAWGKNLDWFNYFLFDYFPGFNKFRSVSMALSMTLLIMPLGAMLALQKCIDITWDKAFQQKVLIAFGMTGGVALLLWLAAGSFDYRNASDASTISSMFGSQDKNLIDLFTNALESDRESLLKKDALRSFTFIALALGFLFLAIQKKISFTYSYIGICLLMIIDLWVVDKRYLYDAKYIKKSDKASFAASAADKKILEDNMLHYRVMNLQNTFQEARTSYFHKSIGGYFAAKMRRYQDLIENQLVKEQQRLIQNIQRKDSAIFANLPAINMLNTRYIKFGEGENDIMLNPNALGNAWFVNELKTVQNADEEMALIDEINPSNSAILNTNQFKTKNTSFTKDSAAIINLVEFAPRTLQYEYESSQDGFVVFSEVYYPHGWTATIDGKKVDLVRVNYVLRGMEVPAGKHKISFRFEPKSFAVGANVSKYSSYILLLFLIGALVLEVKNKKENI